MLDISLCINVPIPHLKLFFVINSELMSVHKQTLSFDKQIQITSAKRFKT